MILHTNMAGQVTEHHDNTVALCAGRSHNYQVIMQIGHRTAGKPRLYKDTVPTLAGHMGSGGQNVPYVAPRSVFVQNSNAQGRRMKEPDEPTFALKSSEQPAVIDGFGHIRRLTPTECELLQGFPAGWTCQGVMEGEVTEISDTRRYMALGNAVTTNVVEQIIRRIYNADSDENGDVEEVG
jgi:site-specific DNA-cytosine methylase